MLTQAARNRELRSLDMIVRRASQLSPESQRWLIERLASDIIPATTQELLSVLDIAEAVCRRVLINGMTWEEIKDATRRVMGGCSEVGGHRG